MNNPNISRRQFEEHPSTMWHGTPDEIGGGNPQYGVHVGTREAARQALNARIGAPHEGDWDGTREYGKTLLGTQRTGNEVNKGEPRLPSGKATYSDNSPVPMTARPNIIPVRIVGPMTNSPQRPHEDFRANGLMAGQLKRGRAKSGYFYTNAGEDEGSVSAVVPSRSHLATFEEYSKR